mgnify:CR=1 FL=1
MKTNNHVLPRRFRTQAVKNAGARLLTGFAIAVSTMAPALAQETFDTAPILAKITTFSGYALVILLAFAAATWGLKAAGLIGRK